MKSGNKLQGQFISKLSVILNKFKDSSTVHVGHEQVKTFFAEFALKDIIVPFITKMDTSEQLSDREKRQYSKVYMAIVETYKDEILMDMFFEKIMQSLNKKSMGVSEVIGYICKTLLNRIQDSEYLYPFVSIILSIFRNHSELAKILKQLIQGIDSNVIGSLQQQIMALLHQKINNAKLKSEYLDTIHSLVLNLQERLTVQGQVTAFLLKYLKHEDWNCRKICVDIGYALLVINKEIGQNVHNIIKQLKYDKIKNVRDSVNNYEVLYKQTYGEEMIQKPVKSQSSHRQAKTMRQTKIQVQRPKKIIPKSPAPAPVVQKQLSQNDRDKSNSHQRSVNSKKKNQNFFKNAKNSDVIRINQQNKSCLIQDQKERSNIMKNFSVHIPKVRFEQSKVTQSKGNFEQYLKNRNSPKLSGASPRQSGVSIAQSVKNIQKNNSIKTGDLNTSKFNYQQQFQNFKKKKLPQKNDNFKQTSSFSPQIIKNSQQDISLSFAQSKVYNSSHDEFITMFRQFQRRIDERLDKFERRIQRLQNQRSYGSGSVGQSFRMQKGRVLSQGLNMQNIRVESPKSLYYNDTPYESKWQSSVSDNIESNLQQKVRVSIANENWDEAFTLALTNNKKNILLNLLQRCVFPTDRTVQQCILLQIKKLLGHTSALKWLKYYLSQKKLSEARLLKLKEELDCRRNGDNKNYEMMRQMVMNEINQKIQTSK